MKILLGALQCKVRGRRYLKPKNWELECIWTTNDNSVTVVDFATSNNPLLKGTMFLHWLNKCSLFPHNETFRNTLDLS
jgi:hypothetical protein